MKDHPQMIDLRGTDAPVSVEWDEPRKVLYVHFGAVTVLRIQDVERYDFTHHEPGEYFDGLDDADVD